MACMFRCPGPMLNISWLLPDPRAPLGRSLACRFLCCCRSFHGYPWGKTTRYPEEPNALPVNILALNTCMLSNLEPQNTISVESTNFCEHSLYILVQALAFSLLEEPMSRYESLGLLSGLAVAKHGWLRFEYQGSGHIGADRWLEHSNYFPRSRAVI